MKSRKQQLYRSIQEGATMSLGSGIRLDQADRTFQRPVDILSMPALRRTISAVGYCVIGDEIDRDPNSRNVLFLAFEPPVHAEGIRELLDNRTRLLGQFIWASAIGNINPDQYLAVRKWKPENGEWVLNRKRRIG